jgi:hypothetical protein
VTRWMTAGQGAETWPCSKAITVSIAKVSAARWGGGWRGGLRNFRVCPHIRGQLHRPNTPVYNYRQGDCLDDPVLVAL